LSTNKILIDGKEFKTNLTTPDSYKLNFYLSEMVNSKVEYCFMEVSSHSIDQERISNLDYNIGVYTNISHDHLNYHKTFKNYIYTKKKFFDSLSKDSYSLINIDDKNSSVMVQNTKSKIKTYSLKKLSDYNIKIIENNIDGLIIQLNDKLIHTQITGKFNAYNLVAVYAVCDILGLDQNKSIELLSKIKPVEGRFQVIAKNGITAIVDFAHTPDAIEKVLVSVKDYLKSDGIIITVVGCGGGRDKEKRNKMGYVSSELSDLTIFTSDNPRNEDPNQIIEDMKMGVDNKKIKKVKTIIDRRDAIKYAVSKSKFNDILLVLGKGHEKYQIVGDKKIEFSDSEVLNNYLKIAI
jgi:UDP-N-acetylmuramoyl-L-alanyl-D-glutamate--2,6-diaminopimelate ligase